jgi:hypothetical protein
VKDLIARSRTIPSVFTKRYATDFRNVFYFCNDTVRCYLPRELAMPNEADQQILTFFSDFEAILSVHEFHFRTAKKGIN